MSWLPKSPKARRRLTLIAAIAPVLALAVGLTLWGLRDSISFFYTPSQADAAKPPPGRSIQLGGLVAQGSVVKHADGRVEFTVADRIAASKVVYERRDTDGSALDLQEVAADRLAVIDGRERRRVDLVEAAQARRVARAGAGMKAAA